MNTQQIKNYWIENGETLHTYQPSQLDNPRLSKPAIDFLINCGLPASCAPGLNFDNCKRVEIPTPNEVFNIEFEELDNYLFIGNNGCGDPLCIDLNKGNQIVFLNHDNDFERIFINSDLEKLSTCLIIYCEFIKSANTTSNSNYLDRNFSDDAVNKLKQDLTKVEEICMEEGAMWEMEIRYL